MVFISKILNFIEKYGKHDPDYYQRYSLVLKLLFTIICNFISVNKNIEKTNSPANICWSSRRLADVLKTSFVFVFRRRLQDVLIKTHIFFTVIRLQKTSLRRLGQEQYIRLGHTSSRCLEHVLKTSLQGTFKTS